MMTQTQTQLRSTRFPTRTRQLADIHASAAKAGFDTRGEVGDPRRERYEAFLMRVIGLPSTKRASRDQRLTVLDELRRMTDSAYRLSHARPVVPVSEAEAAEVLS